jgi:hypothetical protein
VKQAGTVTALARTARGEWLAYQEAMELDPLLPRVLWPRGYQGERVHQERGVFVRHCAQRFQELAGL